MERRVRVLIAEDEPRARQGLKVLLGAWPEVEVVGEAADGREAVQGVAECQPDVALLDARMPVLDGLAATQLIKTRWPQVRVIILTMYPTHRAEALAAGADAFLLKGCPAEVLLAALLNCGDPAQSRPA